MATSKPKPKTTVKKSTRKVDQPLNGGTREIIAKKVSSVPTRARHVGSAVATTITQRSQQATQFLKDHPKVAASLATGIITIASALLAKKIQGKGVAAKSEKATQKLIDSVQKLIQK